MSTKKVYHYVYRITNIKIGKYYYGKRSSTYKPNLDIGIRYFSSSKDIEFIKDQKTNPEDYKYKIVSVHSSCEEAIKKEIRLHDKFDVCKNPKFYNRSKQTNHKFSTFGLPVSKETREKISAKSKMYRHSEESKQKIHLANLGNKWNVGRKHSEKSKEKMRECKKNTKNPSHRLVNIYCYDTDSLIACRVVLGNWCGTDKSLRSNLAATL